jgi:hypothetical protein
MIQRLLESDAVAPLYSVLVAECHGSPLHVSHDNIIVSFAPVLRFSVMWRNRRCKLKTNWHCTAYTVLAAVGADINFIVCSISMNLHCAYSKDVTVN